MCNLDLAQRFLEVTGIKDHVLGMSASILERIAGNFAIMNHLHGACGIKPEKLDALKIFMENADSLLEDTELVMTEMIAKTFTDQEAAFIIDFHQSAIGRRYDSVMPSVIEGIDMAFQNLLNTLRDKVNMEIKEKFDAAVQEIKEGREMMKEFTMKIPLDPEEGQRLFFRQ